MMARIESGKEKEQERGKDVERRKWETRLKSKLIDDQYFCRCVLLIGSNTVYDWEYVNWSEIEEFEPFGVMRDRYIGYIVALIVTL